MEQSKEELKFIEARDEAKKRLQECQKNRQLDSCFKCELMFDCEIRKEYVKAVYESMSLGQGGGFEF